MLDTGNAINNMFPKEKAMKNKMLGSSKHTARYDLAILQSLRKIIRSIDLHSKKLKTTYELTSPQLVTLIAISQHEVITIADLSKEIFLSPSTIVGIIDRLEKKGWIARKRDAKDRRKVFISITTLGEECILRAPSPMQETFSKALSELTDLEQSNIALSLEHVVKLMNADSLDASPILESGAIDSV